MSAYNVAINFAFSLIFCLASITCFYYSPEYTLFTLIGLICAIVSVLYIRHTIYLVRLNKFFNFVTDTIRTIQTDNNREYIISVIQNATRRIENGQEINESLARLERDIFGLREPDE